MNTSIPGMHAMVWNRSKFYSVNEKNENTINNNNNKKSLNQENHEQITDNVHIKSDTMDNTHLAPRRDPTTSFNHFTTLF